MAMRDAVIGCAVGAALALTVGLDRGVDAGEGDGGDGRTSARGVVVTCADFAAIGSFQAPTVTEAGVIASGSADLNVLEFNGLGIVGGASDFNVETGEWLRFDFDGFDAMGVTYHVSYAGNGDGDSTSGESFLEAFGPGGGSLGTVTVGSTGTFDVSAVFSPALISAFEVRPKDGDALRVDTVCYEEELVVCAGDLDGDGDTDVFDFGMFAADFGCGTE